MRDHHREMLRAAFTPFVDRIDRVDLFGSHAMGRARDNSDIDIVVHGELDHDAIRSISMALDDSRLPVTVDLLSYSDKLYPPLKRHIDAVAKTLFTRADLLEPV